MSSTSEVFAAMSEAVAGNGGKSLQRKFKQGKVVFTINGDNVYSLDLSSPTDCKVAEGDIFDGKADLQVLCTEEVMGKMINKEIQPQQAFMKGMLKIKGKMNLAMKLTAVLAATRKKLPTSKL
ncbi:hypothetical protein QTG54_002922 [Skeletonema marinoi]|uniref:SCP2 domain-containing protein n=1 Tax=Skeletonema marinoi TaxID=267567 RepID=A0AAD8YJN5_9STRA|nr:hypothetical protein QTG54_016742 [Skeletonema marinoi]KAK1746315.1 hypothetical protein QTG54_002922 [Skeletonema marinoi]